VSHFKRGCGCAGAALLVFLVAAGLVAYYFIYPWWKKKPPPPSGQELRVHFLDVGQGDAILIVSPEGKVVLVDAGDTGKGKVVLEAMKRYNLSQIDLLIATHAHADHIGGADEVIKATKVLRVLDSSVPPPARETDEADNKKVAATSNRSRRSRASGTELPTTKAYRDLLDTIQQSGAQYIKAEPGQTYDIGGNAIITVLAPIQPLFTRDQVRSGGNEPNANSIVARLDYGEFSMLLTGDAEKQTEERMLSKDANVAAKVLKVGHHGSKYATSEEFIKRVNPEIAIISNGEFNRYGHPSQAVLDRLKAADVRVYRTDLQGEITIVTKGRRYEVKTAKEAKGELWVGREAQKDDSASRGFIAYGDFGPPPREKKEKAEKKVSP
jgi:competence protein ComEC